MKVFLLSMVFSVLFLLPAAFSQNAVLPVDNSVQEVSPPDDSLNAQINQTSSVTLTFAEAADLLEGLKPLKSSAGKVSLGDHPDVILLTDTPEKILEMEKWIKEMDVQRFTMVFELSYAKASQLSEKVQEIITRNIGKVKFDEGSNKLIVTDTAAKIDEVRKLVDTIDQRDQPVSLDVKVLQIILNDEHRLGVDWEAIVSNYHGLVFGNNNSVPAEIGNGKISMGTLSKDDYKVLIEALDTVGNVSVLSNTVIAAINNRETRLLTGQSEPYILTVDEPPAAEAAVDGQNAHSVDVEAKLFVTPTAHVDKTTTIKVRAQAGFLFAMEPIDRDASTNGAGTAASEGIVNVKEGMITVIGGLIKEEKIKVLKKVPILGDVPFLGVAFRSHGRSVRRTETIIFLNPKAPSGDLQESKSHGN